MNEYILVIVVAELHFEHTFHQPSDHMARMSAGSMSKALGNDGLVGHTTLFRQSTDKAPGVMLGKFEVTFACSVKWVKAEESGSAGEL